MQKAFILIEMMRVKFNRNKIDLIFIFIEMLWDKFNVNKIYFIPKGMKNVYFYRNVMK